MRRQKFLKRELGRGTNTMGLFDFVSPKCSKHNTKLTPTGWSFPYPTHICKQCRRDTSSKRDSENEMESLKNRVKALENQLKQKCANG